MVKLPDPKRCPLCGKKPGRVLEAREVRGYIRRRRKCSGCKHRWNSYETLMNPHDIDQKAIDAHG